jgi:pimeloyl-ACP methyl ester carboxylesterase
MSTIGPLRQIDAGVLSVGYSERGPAEGPAVLLLHGWPYDIHSYVVVTSMLAAGVPRDCSLRPRLRHDTVPG